MVCEYGLRLLTLNGHFFVHYVCKHLPPPPPPKKKKKKMVQSLSVKSHSVIEKTKSINE